MKNVLIILMALPLLAFTFGDGHYFDIKEGNENYKNENYDEALRLYERAFSQKGSDVSMYNLGNAYYRKGEYDMAADQYSAMLNAKEPMLAREGLSNFAASQLMAGLQKAGKGDAPAALENLKTAASAYKKILLENPSDKKAKENMEIALNKIKELQKQLPRQMSTGKRQKEQDGSESQDKADGQDEKSDEKQKAKHDKPKDKGDRQEAADEKPRGKMSPEEVRRILEALAQNEEKLQKQLHRMRTRNKEVEKDW